MFLSESVDIRLVDSRGLDTVIANETSVGFRQEREKNNEDSTGG